MSKVTHDLAGDGFTIRNPIGSVLAYDFSFSFEREYFSKEK